MTPEDLASLDPIFAECLRAGGPLGPAFTRPGGFEGLVRIVCEQQLSTRVADVVWARVVAACGLVTHDRLLALDDDTLRTCGLSRQKIAYARGIAGKVADGALDFDRLAGMDDAEATEELLKIKGVGRWTADIYLMASLKRPDIWPVGDLAIQVGIQRLKGWSERPTPERLIALAQPWRPHRTLAARLVWHHYVSMQTAARQAKTEL